MSWSANTLTEERAVAFLEERLNCFSYRKICKKLRALDPPILVNPCDPSTWVRTEATVKINGEDCLFKDLLDAAETAKTSDIADNIIALADNCKADDSEIRKTKLQIDARVKAVNLQRPKQLQLSGELAGFGEVHVFDAKSPIFTE